MAMDSSMGPTGIPDPNNPGYDTAGYPLAPETNPGTFPPPTGTAGVPDPTHPGYDTGGFPLDPHGPGGPAGPDTSRPGQGAPQPLAVDPVFGTTLPTGNGGGGGLIDPFTQPMPDYLHAPSFTPPAFTKPAPFTLPSGQDVLNEDPSYGFRLQQGEDALQHSAAEGGVLNTGNTLKDILGYGQNFASQEYGNAVNRRKGVYDTNYQTQTLDPYKFAYQGAMDAFMPKMADWSAHQNFDWNSYLKSYDIFRNRQRDTVDATTQLS